MIENFYFCQLLECFDITIVIILAYTISLTRNRKFYHKPIPSNDTKGTSIVADFIVPISA